MTTYDQALQLASRLTPVEKARLLESLGAMLKHDLESEAHKHLPWHEFIELTYGSHAFDPIERNQPLAADVRDEVE